MRRLAVVPRTRVLGLSLSALILASAILSLSILPVRAVQWSSVSQVPTVTVANFKPSVTQDNVSDIWLAYESTATQQSYYKVRYQFSTTTAWDSEHNITSPKGFNTGPAIEILVNQTILVVWTSNRTGFQELWYKTGIRTITGVTWYGDKQLTHDNLVAPNGPDSSEIVQDLTGNIWVFYHKVVGSGSNIFYTINKPGTGWTSEAQLTFDTTDILPGATMTVDGRIWVVFSVLSTGNYNIWYKVFSGTGWGVETRLTTYKNSDDGPDIAQSRDGTLWAFWGREIPVSPSTGIFGEDIFYKNSTNLGATWSADTQLTTTGSSATGCILLPCFNFDPSLMQLGKNFFVFWDSNMPDASNFNIFYQSAPILAHDLAVSNIAVNPRQTYPLLLKYAGVTPRFSVNTTIANLGDFMDTAQLSVYANSTIIGSSSYVLAPGQSLLVPLSWNVTNLKPGCYSLKSSIATVSGEIKTANNVLVWGFVRILPLGDVNQDGNVNIVDFSVVAFGYLTTPASARWNPYGDIDNDGVIGIVDLSVVAANYNMAIPTC
jgi:hypothetical protein